jgi:dihydroorotase
MTENHGVLVLKNAHVIDPVQRIDRVADVIVADGRIQSVGEGPAPAGAQTVDLTGCYLTPGWIDIHVHAYGTLGFGDPDAIGVHQGVTSFVDAGGTGIDTLDEFMALLHGRTATSLYAGPHVHPFGILGFEDGERGLKSIAIAKWFDWVAAHPGTVRYIKVPAYGLETTGPINLGKGLAKLLRLPLYVHVGEIQPKPAHPQSVDATVEATFRVCEAGDIITHIYHNNPGRLLDADGKLMPYVKEAERRGVLFDTSFGGYNFSWDVAEKAIAQGLLPHFISSDLQQFNVLGPCFSLANVMTVFLKLGLPLHALVEGVTSRPAAALSLADVAGSLRPGRPADITVFRLESGSFELSDCYTRKRTAETRIVPVMAFKNGRRFDCDVTLAQDERNWFMQVSQDRVPPAAEKLSARQIAFLGSLAKALDAVDWQIKPNERPDLDKAILLQDIVYRTQRTHSLTLRDALTAIFDCFIENPFTMQIGLFLIRLERPFALERLNKVAGRQMAMA